MPVKKSRPVAEPKQLAMQRALQWYNFFCQGGANPGQAKSVEEQAGDLIFQQVYKLCPMPQLAIYSRGETDVSFRTMHPTPLALKQYGDLRTKALLLTLRNNPGAYETIRAEIV